MSCRRICRELIWSARFGELDRSSEPHLEHLASCRGCRDEVGFDRAMVEQLRVALAERVANAAPSPTAWERIRAQAQAPEPRPAARLLALANAVVGRLRFASAMAGTGLALLLALNMEIVPVGVPVTTEPIVNEAAGLEVGRSVPSTSSGGSAVTPALPGMAMTDAEAQLIEASRSRAAGVVPAANDGGPDPQAIEMRVIIRATQRPAAAPPGDDSGVDAAPGVVAPPEPPAGSPS